MPDEDPTKDDDSDKENVPPLRVPLLPYSYRRRFAEWHHRMALLHESEANMHFEAVDMWLELPQDEDGRRTRSAAIIPSRNTDLLIVSHLLQLPKQITLIPATR